MSISIHALRVEGDSVNFDNFVTREISIHALRVEGDSVNFDNFVTREISIHALRVEGDLSLSVAVYLLSAFLSTPSGWRAT